MEGVDKHKEGNDRPCHPALLRVKATGVTGMGEIIREGTWGEGPEPKPLAERKIHQERSEKKGVWHAL